MVSKETQMACGYTHFCDPVTFVDAPTGLVFDPSGKVLYLASTADNAVNDAGETNIPRPDSRGLFRFSRGNLGKTAKLAAVDDSVNLFLIWTLKLQDGE
jgi:hypothetical protein